MGRWGRWSVTGRSNGEGEERGKGEGETAKTETSVSDYMEAIL